MSKDAFLAIPNVWKPELYKIQLDAPTPKPVVCEDDDIMGPTRYGKEYHGTMDHKECEQMLKDKPDGSYLVRRSPGADNYYTLSLRFAQATKHFKIFYCPEKGHFLRENFKKYETIPEMVADGLVDFYMRLHAAPILKEMMSQTKKCYEQSPYMTLHRRKLRSLCSELCKPSKLPVVQDSVETTDPEIADGCDSGVGNGDSKETNEKSESYDNDNLAYEKQHAFKTHTFKGLNWCEFCANFLWGFTSQGCRCEDCGFMAHFKCSELVPAKCVPDLKRLRGIFGVDLTTLVTAHKCRIPFIVKKCVEEVESHGMLQEGIYRISGFADEIEALKMALDKDGEKADVSAQVYSNVNVIAGVLKLYLRLLPVPLITFQSFPLFMESMREKSIGEQVIALRNAVKALPPAHLHCLKYILEHLNRIASHHAINKMNEHNLATVFAPTLIATPQHMTDLSQEISMLAALIGHCHAIFL